MSDSLASGSMPPLESAMDDRWVINVTSTNSTVVGERPRRRRPWPRPWPKGIVVDYGTFKVFKLPGLLIGVSSEQQRAWRIRRRFIFAKRRRLQVQAGERAARAARAAAAHVPVE